MASGLATLVADERELGATVIDMGGGTTGMAVFAEGQLLHTAQLPVGGVHVTNDLARLLSTPVAHAERLKSLMEVHPIYVLKAGDELSPVFESPLSLFDPDQLGPML